jgi:hypothetical protein
MNQFISALSLFVFIVLTSLALAFFNAHVACELWRWFLTPALHVAVPSVLQMYGAFLFVACFTGRSQLGPDKDRSKDTMSSLWREAIILQLSRAGYTIACWLMGWVLTQL